MTPSYLTALQANTSKQPFGSFDAYLPKVIQPIVYDYMSISERYACLLIYKTSDNEIKEFAMRWLGIQRPLPSGWPCTLLAACRLGRKTIEEPVPLHEQAVTPSTEKLSIIQALTDGRILCGHQGGEKEHDSHLHLLDASSLNRIRCLTGELRINTSPHSERILNLVPLQTDGLARANESFLLDNCGSIEHCKILKSGGIVRQPIFSVPSNQSINFVVELPQERYAYASGPNIHLSIIQPKDLKSSISPSNPKRFSLLGSHKKIVNCMIKLPDPTDKENNLLVTGSEDRTLRIWDLKNSKIRYEIKSLRSSVVCLALSVDNLVVAGYGNGNISLYEYSQNNTLNQLSVLKQGHAAAVNQMIVRPDNLMFSASKDNTIRVWDLYNFTMPGQILVTTKEEVQSIALLQDGRLATAVANCIYLYHAQLSEEIDRKAAKVVVQMTEKQVKQLTVISNGRLVSTNDREYTLWNLPTSTHRLISWNRQNPFSKTRLIPLDNNSFWDSTAGLRYSFDEEYRDKKESSFEGKGVQPDAIGLPKLKVSGRRLDKNGYFLNQLEDGRNVLCKRTLCHNKPVPVPSLNDTIELIVGNKTILTFKGLFEPQLLIELTRISNLKKYLIVIHEGIKRWDLNNLDLPPVTFTAPSNDISQLAAMPDGRFLTASENTLQLWDPENPTQGPYLLDGHLQKVTCLAVLPDGRILSGSDDETIRLWDLTPSLVLHHYVFPDGSIMNNLQDETIRLWDFKPPSSVVLHHYGQAVTSLAVGKLGQIYVGAGNHIFVHKLVDLVSLAEVPSSASATATSLTASAVATTYDVKDFTIKK